jgi:hypothetical protein
MHWITSPEKDTDNQTLGKRLWYAADQPRPKAGVTAKPFFQPVLGSIFLRSAGVRFTMQRVESEKASASNRHSSRVEFQTVVVA